MADNDVSKMKVADLKRELKVRGLRTTGNKDELVERLQSALIEGDVFDDTAMSEDLLNDDVLNDEELDEEAYLSSTHDEDIILNSPHDNDSSKTLEAPTASTAVSTQQKKVVLKRKLAPSLSSNEEPIDGTKTILDAPKTAKLSDGQVESTNGSQASNGSVGESNVVKLSQLTMKERLELRAKKFGAAPSLDALKQARAERFGLVSNVNTSNPQTETKFTGANSTNAATTSGSNVDILKKRAERFGGSVSNVMVTIENKEKLLKRQQRFEATSTANKAASTPPTVVSSSNDYAEKAKIRAERFKTST